MTSLQKASAPKPPQNVEEIETGIRMEIVEQAQNGCQMLARFPPYKNRSWKIHDLMYPKIVLLQKYAGILTCPNMS